MKIILGTGQLGLAVLDVLLKANPNEEITLVNRSGKIKTTVPHPVQIIAADITNPHTLECIAREAEVIYSCTDVPYQQWSVFYPAAAEALAYTLSKTKARVVFADNLYSYGNVWGEVMTETLPHKARTKKGKIRTSVINRLLLSGEAFNSRVAIVKASDFIGPRIHKGVFGTDFLHRLHEGKSVLLFGKPQLPHTFTYITDFATALITVGNADDAFGQVWHVPNAPAISLKDWIRLFEKETGKHVKVKLLPKPLIRLAALIHSFTRELYELSYQYEHPYLVDHRKYTSRFGGIATHHSTIVKETVAWYKQQISAEEQHT